MDPIEYRDFELKIQPGEGHYIAKVIRSPFGEPSCTFTLPFSDDRLENLVLKLGRLRSVTRRIYSEEMEAAQELGGKLFEAIFSDEVLACFRSSLNEVRGIEDTGLRLKLWLQDVPELSDIPWEFIYDSATDRFLAQSNQTPIVRYLEMPGRIQPLTISLPLKILVMISNPSDYTRLDVERERSMLLSALEPLSKEGKVQVELLEFATLRALQHQLRDDEYHIFHFIGHGGFNKRTDEGVLVMEDRNERGWQAGAHRVGTILHDHRSLRLAVLNACEGARNSRTDPFAGVATNLIRQGIPAVVAMQFEITDDAAILFASEFYSALADGFPVDSAVAEARKAIYGIPNDIEWGTPVLYMRSSDGVLFNVTRESIKEDYSQPTAEPLEIPSVAEREPETTLDELDTIELPMERIQPAPEVTEIPLERKKTPTTMQKLGAVLKILLISSVRLVILKFGYDSFTYGMLYPPTYDDIGLGLAAMGIAIFYVQIRRLIRRKSA